MDGPASTATGALTGLGAMSRFATGAKGLGAMAGVIRQDLFDHGEDGGHAGAGGAEDQVAGVGEVEHEEAHRTGEAHARAEGQRAEPLRRGAVGHELEHEQHAAAIVPRGNREIGERIAAQDGLAVGAVAACHGDELARARDQRIVAARKLLKERLENLLKTASEKKL